MLYKHNNLLRQNKEHKMAIKHVGRLVKNKRRVIVAYRVLPNDPENCLVVTTENLMSEEHDTLIKLVESDAGQQAYELAEAMARSVLPDGRNMLAGFHTTGKLVKVATKEVEMLPDTKSSVNLAELNNIIAQQKGVTVADLAIQPEGGSQKSTPVEETVQDPVEAYTNTAQPTTNDVLTDEDLAAQYRSQADAMFKEAKALREKAEELVPTKKRAKAKTEVSE
jgi:hypothetical protein